MNDVTGFEEIEGNKTLNYPAIRILNSMSKPIKDKVDGAEEGIFFDVSKNLPLGHSIEVIVIGIEIYTSETKEQENGFTKEVARHPKEYYYAHNMGTYPIKNDGGNTLLLVAKHFYLVKMREYWQPYVLYWNKSNFKYNSKFISQMKRLASGEVRLWNGIWKIGISQVKNISGFTYYTLGKDDKVNAEFVDYTPNSLMGVVQKYREEWQNYRSAKHRTETLDNKERSEISFSAQDSGINYEE